MVTGVGDLEPVHPAHPGWFDYVLPGASRFTPSATLCTESTAALNYFGCVHSGVTRQATVSGAVSCSDVAMISDSLGAFEWVCVQDGSTVRVISTRLKDDVRLNDLLVGAGFRSVTVSVVDREGGSHTSLLPVVWSSEPVTDVATSGALTLQADRITRLTAFNANVAMVSRSALVVPAGQRVRCNGVNGQWDELVTYAGADFTWVEGDFYCPTYPQQLDHGSAIRLNGGAAFNVVRNVRLSGFQVDGPAATIDLRESAHFNFLDHVVVADCQLALRLDNSSNNVLTHLTLNNLDADGIRLANNADANVFADVQVFSVGDNPVQVGGGSNNLFLDVTIAQSNGTGLFVTPDGAGQRTHRNLFMNLLSVDTGSSGSGDCNAAAILNPGSNPPLDNALLNTAARSGSSCHAVYIEGSTLTHVFSKLKIGSGQTCHESTTVLNAACAVQAGAGDATTTSLPSSLSTVIKRVVSVDDTQNGSDVSGVQAYPQIASVDMVTFEARERGWGEVPSGGKVCNGSNTCQIFDWRLLASETLGSLREANAMADPTNTRTHRLSAASQGECDQTLKGAQWSSASSECLLTYIPDAVEVLGEPANNGNGLCERGESCLHTPNIGAYQGHGALESLGVVGTGGDSIHLFKYATNGIP